MSRTIEEASMLARLNRGQCLTGSIIIIFECSCRVPANVMKLICHPYLAAMLTPDFHPPTA